ncbi:MAG: hypothetical protein JWP41_1111 [Ramlibacter sp.]|jgi:hypothetical protein|nr:hypothetical protein [Ramlibacter sp.]
MRLLSTSSLIALSTLALLSACGGGNDGGDFQNDPRSSGQSGSVAVVASAPDAVLNGTYGSTDVALNDVVKVNPIGGEPETCRTRFSGLQQTGGTRKMDGDIRYIPGTNLVRTTFVSIDTVEFRLQGESPAQTIDRAANRVTYTNAVLTSTNGNGRTITLNGTVPVRAANKPEGC